MVEPLIRYDKFFIYRSGRPFCELEGLQLRNRLAAQVRDEMV